MQVVLLGTGSADGWPNPFCACASCVAAARAGEVRAHTAALVDGRVLVDAGPDVPRAAARLGRSLRDVELLLLTHAHPDHVHGLLLLAREWAQPARPLVVAGPAPATDELAHWVPPQGSVTVRTLRSGDVLTHAGCTVRALGAVHDGSSIGDALLYDVTAADGGRLLHATDTGPLGRDALEAVTGRAFDVVLLEETFGDAVGHGTDHLDLVTFPELLAELRRCGAVTSATRVVPVHLSHHNPPPAELRRRLAAWQVELLPDGAVVDTRVRPGRAAPARRTLVTGGTRSGKSTLAERLLADREHVTYVATALAEDDEMRARVGEHQRRRPPAWRTVETTDLAGALQGRSADDAVLVDCLTLWLARLLDACGAWDGGDRDEVVRRVDAQLQQLVDVLRGTPARVVLVTNEVGSGVVPATSSGRLFRDLQGQLNARLAAACDEVLLVVAGQVVPLREPAATVSP